MRHYDKARIGADERLKRIWYYAALAVAGYPAEFNAIKLHNRAHNGVVLHAGYYAMLARAQQALYYEIKPRRCAGGDNDVRSLFIEVEKPLCAFPKAERNKPRIRSRCINGAVDGCADIVHIVLHARAHAGGLWEGGCGIIKINGIHFKRLLNSMLKA